MNKEKDIEMMFRRHYERMYCQARYILGDDDESQDVVSDVFTDILTGKTIIMPDNEAAYLLRCVRNRCLNLIEHKSVKERIARQLLCDAEILLTEKTDERLDRINLLIEHLEPPIRKLIFRLRYLHNKSYQEVAEEVGVSKVTVFNHLSKALDWIRSNVK